MTRNRSRQSSRLRCKILSDELLHPDLEVTYLSRIVDHYCSTSNDAIKTTGYDEGACRHASQSANLYTRGCQISSTQHDCIIDFLDLPISQNTGTRLVSALSLHIMVWTPVKKQLRDTQTDSMQTPKFHESRNGVVKKVKKAKKAATKFATGTRGYVGSILARPEYCLGASLLVAHRYKPVRVSRAA